MSIRDAAGSCAQLGAILLAAGGSSRLGHPKQLIDAGGESLVVRQARLLLGLGPAVVVVVTGAENQAIRSQLEGLPVRIEHNAEWQRGMGRSLACGIRAMPERARAALVLLCDQWKVGAEDLQGLVDTWVPEPHSAVVAAYEGTTGPPAILPRALFEQLARLRGDTGAKRVLKRWNGKVRSLRVPDAAPDVDVPADLARPARDS